jgi:hypothetical protein
MRVPITEVVSAVVLFSFATVVPAQAFDLTGHWTGKWSCKGFAAPFDRDGKLVNKFTSSNGASTLAISQSGGTFGAVIDLNDGTFRYNGFAMASVKTDDVGEAVLLGCSTGNTLPSAATGAEIMRAAVKTKGGTFKASFKAVSIFADDFPEVETCKYSYTRIDTIDPGVATCP